MFVFQNKRDLLSINDLMGWKLYCFVFCFVSVFVILKIDEFVDYAKVYVLILNIIIIISWCLCN